MTVAAFCPADAGSRGLSREGIRVGPVTTLLVTRAVRAVVVEACDWGSRRPWGRGLSHREGVELAAYTSQSAPIGIAFNLASAAYVTWPV